MADPEERAHAPGLLCFDGSGGAAEAIARASDLFAPSSAVVLTVWEPIELWAPWDPATLIDAGIAKVTSEERELDEIAREAADRVAERGAQLAREAGFAVSTEVLGGKSWKTICDCARDLDARVIVLGARGLSPVKSMLLGSVSSRVITHADRPVLVVHASGAA